MSPKPKLILLGKAFSICQIRVYSSACQNLAAILKDAIWGNLVKSLAGYFDKPNFGMPKSGNVFGSHFKSCHLEGLRKILASCFGMPNFGYFFGRTEWQEKCHLKPIINLNTELGPLSKEWDPGAKNGQFG